MYLCDPDGPTSPVEVAGPMLSEVVLLCGIFSWPESVDFPSPKRRKHLSTSSLATQDLGAPSDELLRKTGDHSAFRHVAPRTSKGSRWFRGRKAGRH